METRDCLTVEDPVSRLCDEFERRWSNGEALPIEAFLARVPPAEQTEAFERLLAIDLAYRALSGVTIHETEYRARFPEFHAILDRAFHELGWQSESHDKSHSSTLLWQKVARAVHSAALYPPGTMIDRYRLLNQVGRGGFGEVWRALDTELGRDVAIKLARSDRHLSDAVMKQLRSEARHAASLKHPQIVPVYDVGQGPCGTFLVTEFVVGESLAARLRRGHIEPNQAVKYAIQVAEALHHAHLRGLVHRDVKPGNILLRADTDEAVLTDFGLAITEADLLHAKGSTVGTWWYMSPEQARGESHRVDARSDVFSLGVVLYQMLTGRLPFLVTSREEYIDQLLHRPPRPPRTINDALDRELEQICFKSLAKAPAERYSTCADLAAALRQWSEHITAARTEPAAPAPAAVATLADIRAPEQNRTWRLLLGAVLVLGLYPTAQFLFSSRGSTPPTEGSGAGSQRALTGGQRTLPREMLLDAPVIFAKSIGEIAEKPRFDSQLRSFAVRSPDVQWIAAAGEVQGDQFELEADIQVQDWIGVGGLVWRLAVDTRAAPNKKYHCLGVVYQRVSANDPAELRVQEFVIQEYGYNNRHLEHIGSIAVKEVAPPRREWAPLKCRIGPERITVWFDTEDEWIVPEEMPDAGWLPPISSKTVGLIGAGPEVKVRNLSVKSRR